jgi:hypothetical protein
VPIWSAVVFVPASTLVSWLFMRHRGRNSHAL